MKLRHICAGVLAGAVICSSLTGCTLKTHTAESGAQSSAAQEAESSAAAAVSAGKTMAESASELMSAAAGTEVSGADIGSATVFSSSADGKYTVASPSSAEYPVNVTVNPSGCGAVSKTPEGQYGAFWFDGTLSGINFSGEYTVADTDAVTADTASALAVSFFEKGTAEVKNMTATALAPDKDTIRSTTECVMFEVEAQDGTHYVYVFRTPLTEHSSLLTAAAVSSALTPVSPEALYDSLIKTAELN